MIGSGTIPADVLRGMLWMGVLVAVLAAAGGLLGILRRRMQASSRAATPVFTLEELRRLRDHGDLTIPEYERLTASLAEKLKSRRPKLDIQTARNGDFGGSTDAADDAGFGDDGDS